MSPPHPLDPVLRPSSIAVVGASSDPRKRGHRVLGALRGGGYTGAVYPINPKGGTIDGFEVHTSVEALPQAPDLALVCTPAETVPGVVEACGRRGVRGAVILAVGFGESGREGAALEARLLEAARRHAVRVVGPNTSGIMDLTIGMNLVGAPDVRSGSMSLLVQSGNMALALMNEAVARSEEGVAVCLGVGNELDLGFHDYLDYLGSHDATRVIAVYAEAFTDPRAFLAVAARVTRQKPVVLVKGARSERGREAARSHTGALAGAHDTLRAALRQVGVVEVGRTDELFHVSETLAAQPAVGPEKEVAILSDGGGQGTLAADTLSELGVPLSRLADRTQERLRELLGRAAAVGNPVDLAGAADTDPEAFARALELLTEDDAVGAVLVVGLFGGYGVRFHADLAAPEERAADRMAELVGARGKALVVQSMYAPRRTEPLRSLQRRGVPVVESLEVACRCVAEVWRRGRTLARAPWRSPGAHDQEAARGEGEVVRVARDRGRASLTEPEAAGLLRSFGVPVPEARLCATAGQTADAVRALGRPAALKVVAHRVTHKTEAGGVALGVGSAEEAATAFERIRSSTSEHLRGRGLEDTIEGVQVTGMLEPPLAELLVGARRDAELGPVLTVGAGGTWVELVADLAHRLLPVDAGEVCEMLAELRCHGLLAGARGRPPADLGAVTAAVTGVARCLLDTQGVAEIEVNPLFVYADGAWAADALVVLGEREGA